MTDATLLVIQGPEQGRKYDLTPEPMHLGRGGQNEIRILDTEVSRRHALISRSQGTWQISDLKSSNGTYVNGQSVTAASIRSGDQIQIGRTILLFTNEPQQSDRTVVERINLVASSALDDQSRIVGQARPPEQANFGGWTQAGANLQLLYQITEEVVRPTTSLDDLLKRILDLTLEAVGADRGCMLVANSKNDRIEPRVVGHRSGVNVDERMPISTSIVEYVIHNGQGVRTSDAQHDSRFDTGQSIMRAGIREAMCVPMRGRFELMGVIYVDTTRSSLSPNTNPDGNRFSDQLLRLLLAIGRQSALAIENSRYQDALVTSERLAAVGQTIAIMSHHIKNILQGVRGGGYLIDTGLKQNNEEMIRKGWGVVDRNQERIYNLVMDMLTFSKEREPQLKMSRLREVLNDVTELMQSRCTERGIELTLKEVTPVPKTQFDPEGLHRAVLNMLTNAVDALDEREHPRIEVRYGADRAHEQVWVEIEDNGRGIEDGELSRLFQLFESSKGLKGTGLGLAVSQKILQEHGGTITVKTRANVGTCFRLEWPLIIDEGESADNINALP
ncbi:ATP-binding protein [Planctomicrobium sp. SH661]|uniref:sensor histidine kinase n=1 Tax=Planctomicrobium sp. SH661 TaxID=3448124 RepID=UPI003F5BF52D